ncbi:hypothetical protein Tco_0385519 [Tanacetum coccineum]
MEEPIEVLGAKITIRSDLSFLTDVKKKLDQPGNKKCKTLFLATKFGIWLDLPAFANDNHLLNYIFHHQRKNERDSKKDKDKSVEPPKKKIKVVDYDEPQNTTNVAKENALCEFDAIRADDYDEADNSYIIDKEDVLGEFDATKATVALKERYHNTLEDSVKQACNKSDSGVSDVFHQELASEKHQFTSDGLAYIYEESQDKYSVSQLLQLASNEKYGTAFDCTQLEGSVGYDDMLAPSDMMVNEENILETKLDETVVDSATAQATPPPNAIEEHEYHPTDKVEVKELHPPPKLTSLIYNFEMVDAEQLFNLPAVQSSPPPNGIGDQNPHPTDMVEYLEPHPTDNVELPTVEHPAFFLLSTVLGKKIVPLQLNCVNMELP